MIECEACHRHFKAESTDCPFCTKASSPAWRAMQLAAGVVTTAVLTACYGTAGFDETGLDTTDSGTTTEDVDGDGVNAPDDCDDTNAAINPNAVEICDNQADDDCDGDTDADDADCAAS